MILPDDPRSRQNVRQATFVGQRHATSTGGLARAFTKVTSGKALSSCTLCLSREYLQRRVDSSKRAIPSEQHQHIEYAGTDARAGERDAQRLK